MELEKDAWGTYLISGPRHKYRERLMFETLRSELSISKISKVLEAGCGSASFSFELLKKNMTVKAYGFDIQKGYLEIIQKNFKAHGLANRFYFQEGTFEKLPEAISQNCPYDLVVLGEVLEHIKNDKQAVRKIYKILAPGGYALISVPQKMKYWSISDVLAGHYRRYEKDEVISLFENEGFKIITLRHWGWPIVRYYHSLIYTPIKTHKSTQSIISGSNCKKSSMKCRIMQLAKITGSQLLYASFQIDRLFAPFLGHGLIGLFQKNRERNR